MASRALFDAGKMIPQTKISNPFCSGWISCYRRTGTGMFGRLMEQMKQAQGYRRVKGRKCFKRGRRMNNIQAYAGEIVNKETIYRLTRIYGKKSGFENFLHILYNAGG